jgi:hypothetical protein
MPRNGAKTAARRGPRPRARAGAAPPGGAAPAQGAKAACRGAGAAPTGGACAGREKLKGKCALGPFLSILVIECQHKCFGANLCKVVDKVQIMSKGMFLDLVHCFMD